MVQICIIKAEDIDYFEAVFLLNIDKNTPLRSRAVFNLQVFHSSFGDEPGYYFCSYADFYWTKSIDIPANNSN